MNKQEIIKEFKKIVSNTRNTKGDYVIALCQISKLIYKLDEPKQDLKWQKLKKIITGLYAKAETGCVESCVTRYILNKMQELEREDVKD